jgi:isoleucyl-tRNA synthetase
VVTHGFVVTESGKKMSKSLGNDVPPERVIAKSGAEILRLWVAMVDYREEVRFGDEILARTIEAYRKIRNTLRYLVANLYDFDPATDLLPRDQLLEVDRYALAEYADAAQRILRAYEGYDFPTIFQVVNALATVELSAFYFDVSKDRLYTFGARAPERRSAQTAMYLMADGLVRLIAPVLPVTADELWRHLPGTREPSVHLARFPDGLDRLADWDLVGRWHRLIAVRDTVNAAIEAQRQQKVVGTPLEAHVHLEAGGEAGSLLEAHRDALPMLFIASQVTLATDRGDAAAPLEADEVRVSVTRAEGTKCVRCWRYVAEVAGDGLHEGLCGRCMSAVSDPGSAPLPA